jgi:hypothetical protein
MQSECSHLNCHFLQSRHVAAVLSSSGYLDDIQHLLEGQKHASSFACTISRVACTLQSQTATLHFDKHLPRARLYAKRKSIAHQLGSLCHAHVMRVEPLTMLFPCAVMCNRQMRWQVSNELLRLITAYVDASIRRYVLLLSISISTNRALHLMQH